MKVIVLIVIVVTIWQWNCISSLPTKNETVHHCPPGHHRDPVNLERSRRNVFSKISSSINNAGRYVGKKLHIIKRNVNPELDHNKTDLSLENRTNEEVVRVRRRGTESDNSTVTLAHNVFENDNNSTIRQFTDTVYLMKLKRGVLVLNKTNLSVENSTNEEVVRVTRSETGSDNSTATLPHNETTNNFENDNNSTTEQTTDIGKLKKDVLDHNKTDLSPENRTKEEVIRVTRSETGPINSTATLALNETITNFENDNNSTIEHSTDILHLRKLKRDVLDHNKTDLNLENRTIEGVVRVTRSETKPDNATASLAHNETVSNIEKDNNSTIGKLKRDVLDHNKTDLNLENQTNKAIVVDTRRETQSENSTATLTDKKTISKSETDNNSTIQPFTNIHIEKFEEIEGNDSTVLNIPSFDRYTHYNQKGQANVTFFIEFFQNNDTNVKKDIKAETPIQHHHHHRNMTKRATNEDVTGMKTKRSDREIFRSSFVNGTLIETNNKDVIDKSLEKFPNMRKCTCIVSFGTQTPLLSETTVEASSEPILADLICSHACSELSKIYYTTEQQKFCKRIDDILRAVLQKESKNVDVTRDLIYCQVLPDKREIPEQPVFPKISWTNVIILNVFACLIGLTFLLSVHLLCNLCFYVDRKQREKWIKQGIAMKMGSIRVKQNKTGNAV